MTIYKWLKGDAAGGGSGDSDASPYNTINQAVAANGTFPDDDIHLWVHPGAPIVGNTDATSSSGQGFRVAAGRNLTIRPYGSGDGRPLLRMTRRGFKLQTTGSFDGQDFDMEQVNAGSGDGIYARDGGGCRLVNSEIRGFNTAAKIGTGLVQLDGVFINKPYGNGIMVDAATAAPVGLGGYIKNFRALAADPATQNDLLVLHDGGYGLRTGWLLDGVRVEVQSGGKVESGIDIQQQFKGVTLRNFEIIGASQWGIVMGSFLKNGASAYTCNTKLQMLDKFNREGAIGNFGAGTYTINGGHIAFVIADGANNGIWQLTGDDPSEAVAWTGPMTAEDLAADPNLIYGGLVRSCVAGVQIQHPGTQMAGVRFLDITGGDWIGPDASGSGNILSLYDMGYDCKLHDLVLASSSGKYQPADGSAPRDSTKAAVLVKALHSRIAQRTRATLKGSVIWQKANHTGAHIELVSANDRGDLITDYVAYVGAGAGPSAALVDDAGTSRTLSAWATSNGGSDAHSFFVTQAAAGIDDDARPLDGSLLIDTGVARSGLDGSIPNTDSEGRAITGTPEIGGYVYVSEAAQAAAVPTPRRRLRAKRTPGTPPVPLTAPDDVTGLAAGSATAVAIPYTWDAADRATYYELRHAIAGTDAWSDTTDIVTGGATHGSATGLDPAYTWDVQIRAGNGAGVSAWSASVSAATAAGVWYRVEDGALVAAGGLPAMAERYMATGASSNAGAFADPDVYTLLADNGGAAGGVSLVAVDDNVERRNNAVLALLGMASGEQRLIALQAEHEASGTQSFYWDFGHHSALAAMYGLHVSAGGLLTFTSRGLGSTTSTNTPLTLDSGPDYADFDGQGPYLLIIDIHSVSAVAVDVEVRMVHATVGTAVWTGSAIDCSKADASVPSDTLPGISAGLTAAQHGGLMIAARMKSLAANGEPEKLLGAGTVLPFQARQHATYDAARIGDAVIAWEAADGDPRVWWLA